MPYHSDLGQLPDCANPPKGGNTYEITIKDTDRLIITVESQFVRTPIKTMISPRGIEQAQTSMGLVYHKVDWSVKPHEISGYEEY